MIYGITDCPACLRAQATLMELEIEYIFIETDFSPSYRASIKEEFEWQSFPIIVKAFEGGETLVGGYDEMIADLPQVCDTELGVGLCPIIKKD
jgi:glutaredoxin